MIRSALYSKGLLTPSSVPWRGYPLSPRLITARAVPWPSPNPSQIWLNPVCLLAMSGKPCLTSHLILVWLPPSSPPFPYATAYQTVFTVCLASSTDSKAIISVGHKISPQERFSEGKSLCPQFPMSFCRLIHAYVYKTLVLYFKCWRHNRDCLRNNLSPSLLLLPAFI